MSRLTPRSKRKQTRSTFVTLTKSAFSQPRLMLSIMRFASFSPVEQAHSCNQAGRRVWRRLPDAPKMTFITRDGKTFRSGWRGWRSPERCWMGCVEIPASKVFAKAAQDDTFDAFYQAPWPRQGHARRV